jgi:hypothetical protein
MIRLRAALSNLVRINQSFDELKMGLDEIKINQGLVLAELQRNKKAKRLKDYEFKVFSQWGEDGIIQRLISCIPIKNKTFIEFGVEDFFESNCRFLLMKDNWAGFVIDGSSSNISRLKSSYFYWKHDLKAIDAFVTRENINDLLATSEFEEDLGLLSIDIDGNDYYIFKAITSFRPRLLILEYNAIFGHTRKISIPYEANFCRTNKHYSNLYFGASLAAITHIAMTKGYSLVGTGSAGCNAFFVRNDLLNDHVQVLSVEEAFSPSLFRESRDPMGNFTFVGGRNRVELIKGLPVFNVETGTSETL